MFVGRTDELSAMNRLYAGDRFEMVVLYGRRRVGKTTLIREFCKDKPCIFHIGLEMTERENMESFSRAVFRHAMPSVDMPAFSSWDALFSYVGSLATKERLVLVIDEYPYLAASVPAISSMLQAHIDHEWKNGNLFLILCGSSMSFMEEQVLGAASPLYGRRTAQIKVLPFTFGESEAMLPEFTREERAILYGVTGGIPEYLQGIDRKLGLDDNLMQMFFTPYGRLHEEPFNLLRQEMRNPASYNAILSAIAAGASKLNEIATKTGMETAACSNLLSSLIALGLVSKEIPVFGGSARNTIYRLEDGMFRFWFRHVRPDLGRIAMGMGELVYRQDVMPLLSQFMGSVFEQMSMQHLWRLARLEQLPIKIQQMGRWWGSNPVTKRQEEIDILAYLGQDALFGECKWTRQPVGPDVLDNLERKSRLLPFQNRHLWLFSKNGFTNACHERVSGTVNVRLVSFDTM